MLEQVYLFLAVKGNWWHNKFMQENSNNTNNIFPIIVVLIIVLLLVGGAYWYSQNDEMFQTDRNVEQVLEEEISDIPQEEIVEVTEVEEPVDFAVSNEEIEEIRSIANSLKIDHSDFIDAKLTLPDIDRNGL